MNNPYEKLPEKAFWKLSVSNRSMFDIAGLWSPKFHIQKDQYIATFGSCFSQHFGSVLKQRGYRWLSTEAPPFGLNDVNSKRFNYNVFSARTGNIYTASLLKQWTEWALEKKEIPDEVWERDGRFYDPFRPRIEPNGFASKEELRNSLEQAVQSFKEAIEKADYFVFTLGLTESWMNSEFGYEYPMCPGTVAGEFDDNKHKFVNQQFTQIFSALSQSMDMMKKKNPKLKFILTVSPIPLTASNSNQHVLIATMASKSTLRAVTNQLTQNEDSVDYFPSYEIINSPIFKGAFFEPNQRSVNSYGVNFVMDNFFKCLGEKFGRCTEEDLHSTKKIKTSVEICEEQLLEAFGK